MFNLERITEWYYWTPKRGRHKGKIKYVALLEEQYNTHEAILASESTHKDYNLNMHKGQITAYQWDKNCERIENTELLKRLNFRFIKYRKYYKDMKIKKEAKSLLMRGGK